MAKLNIERTRKALQSFDFKTLFIEELGWSNPVSNKIINENIKEVAINRKSIAELSGAVVFEITTPSGEVPEPKQRMAVAKEIQKQHFEHVLIFVDKDRKQSIWHWLKNQDKKVVSREHFFFRHQPGDGFIAKIASLVVDISEFDREGNIAIAEVASRIKTALDIERVVKKFFRDYQNEYIVFLDLIEGIDNEADRRWYASVILNRLMFIYFLQKKMFLDNGNTEYLNHKLEFSKKDLGKNKFYSEFLSKLFFEGFAKHESQRSAATHKLIGKIKYLNGGLFLLHKIEVKYQGEIRIPDQAFDNLFALFNRYSWTLDDTPGGADNEMNPDVLGYIFEKYINQKAFGAYYTRTEITEYLCEQTVYKLILDEVNGAELPDDIPEKLKQKLTTKRYDSIAELLLHLDAATCRKLVVGENAVLPNLSLLDPACGSGAFLVAAMKTLINVYAAILGKIEFLGDKKLTEWKQQIEKDHPSINYYIKKQIITNNLYGVDLMEEATEIAKLRLFLALVASAETVEQLEPLPNIDFNIMSGNSLIGLMRVDENQYNHHQKGDLFKKSYSELVGIKERAIRDFKNFEKSGVNPELLKQEIERIETEANATLNLMLGHEFSNLGIKYEQVTWDEKKNKEGKSIKRSINIKDIEALEPFHWGYEFSEIFRKKDGFDAIIANPPWEIFKPSSKEFFKDHTQILIQRKMRIEDFNKEKKELLKDKNIKEEWLNYLSKFPHASQFYRKSKYYNNQTSVIGERKTGSDINLYKLFLEQSFNLLKKGGRCGIIVPSGIYLDAGNMELRNLLFDNCTIENLYGISNEKFLFEGVEHNIKYTLLSFQKGGKTEKFNVCFKINPRVAVAPKDLDFFFNDSTKEISISVEQIKQLSPTSLAIPEIRNEVEFKLLLKLSEIPILGEDTIKFGNEFHMTNDADIFNNINDEIHSGILCEGKTIHQYKYLQGQARYWVNLIEGRKRILGRKTDEGQILPYQRFRIAFRGIARATDSRTMIATIVPPNVFTSNSLAIVVNEIPYLDQLFYLGLFNSITFDFTLRSKISSNINFFYIYNCSCPRLKPKDIWFNAIVERVARLICTTEEFAELWEEIMKTKWSEKKAATTEFERNKLRAELDGIIAHIYGLTEEEFAYILSTFPVVPQPQKVATQNAYRDVERGLIKPN
jgi:hypothetical protein